MLKLRIISALVMVPLVIWGVLELKGGGFALAVMLVMTLCAWEWGQLVPLHSTLQRVAYTASVIMILLLVWRFAGNEVFVNGLLWLTLCWWIFALFWISHPDISTVDQPRTVFVKAFAGWLLLASTWLALVVLHSRPDQGAYWVLFVLSLIWVADSGAFFTGRQWGRRKLAPLVSPGKTWAGVYGALAACALYALIAAQVLNLPATDIPGFLLVCLITVLFSIGGDLFESLLKRQRGVKDSGRLIPGHGGLLDRLDSLLAAAPVFVLGLHWIGL